MMKAKYLAHMGSDLAVVNSARVSFGKIIAPLFPVSWAALTGVKSDD